MINLNHSCRYQHLVGGNQDLFSAGFFFTCERETGPDSSETGPDFRPPPLIICSYAIDALERAVGVLKQQNYDRAQAALIQVRNLSRVPTKAKKLTCASSQFFVSFQTDFFRSSLITQRSLAF